MANPFTPSKAQKPKPRSAGSVPCGLANRPHLRAGVPDLQHDLGQRGAARRALDQRDAEIRLELAQPLRDCRLRHVQRIGRLPEAAAVGDRDKLVRDTAVTALSAIEGPGAKQPEASPASEELEPAMR